MYVFALNWKYLNLNTPAANYKYVFSTKCFVWVNALHWCIYI